MYTPHECLEAPTTWISEMDGKGSVVEEGISAQYSGYGRTPSFVISWLALCLEDTMETSWRRVWRLGVRGVRSMSLSRQPGKMMRV